MKVIKDRGNGVAPFAFDPAELGRQYRRLPLTVLADLAELCFADQPTYDPDPRLDARQQGRRDVWLHINQYLKLTSEQLERIYEGRGQVLTTEEEFLDG